jgi:outer membrane biosynthesis protein TonB
LRFPGEGNEAAEGDGIEGMVTTTNWVFNERSFQVAASLPANSNGSPMINSKGEAAGLVTVSKEGDKTFTAGDLGGTTLYPEGANYMPTGVVTEESVGGVKRIGEKLFSGLAVKRVAPAYPKLAQQKRVEGTVVVQVTVNENGDIENVKVLSAELRCLIPGQEEVPQDAGESLKQAAIEAARQWKFIPTTFKGERIKVIGTITANFHL